MVLKYIAYIWENFTTYSSDVVDYDVFTYKCCAFKFLSNHKNKNKMRERKEKKKKVSLFFYIFCLFMYKGRIIFFFIKNVFCSQGSYISIIIII